MWYVQSRNQSISWLSLPLIANAANSWSVVTISFAFSIDSRCFPLRSFGGYPHRFPIVSQSYLRIACFCSLAILNSVRSRLFPWCCCSKRCPICRWWICWQDLDSFLRYWVSWSYLRLAFLWFIRVWPTSQGRPFFSCGISDLVNRFLWRICWSRSTSSWIETPPASWHCRTKTGNFLHFPHSFWRPHCSQS